MNAIGFVNLHDNPNLGKLTETRPLAAVTFLGRYGLIDSTLSNFSNSGINKIEILTESHNDAIRTHIQNGNVWISNTRTGFLRVVLNEKALSSHSNKNTDIANIQENIPLDWIDEDYIVVAAPYFLANIDYREVVKQHEAKQADISVLYLSTDSAKDDFLGCGSLILNKDGSVAKIGENKGENEKANISMEAYVFNREVFFSILKFSKEISNTASTIRKMVQLYANNHMVNVIGYEVTTYVAPILDLDHYIKESFKLLDSKNRKAIFDLDWPLYTTTHNTPPALYGPKAEVSNSFVANGAIVKGKVTNSIISRDVIVDEGAVVNNSILFSKTHIGKNCHVDYLVTDKNVEISNVKNLCGDEEDFLLVAKGAKI